MSPASLTLADNRLIHKTPRDSQEAAEAVLQQLDSVSQLCHDTASHINPDNVQAFWCTLDNRAAGKPMPAVTFDGAVVNEQVSELPWVPLRQYADLQAICENNSNGVRDQASHSTKHQTAKPHSDQSPKTSQGGASQSSKVRPPSMETVHTVSTSSLTTEVERVTHALRLIASRGGQI